MIKNFFDVKHINAVFTITVFAINVFAINVFAKNMFANSRLSLSLDNSL